MHMKATDRKSWYVGLSRPMPTTQPLSSRSWAGPWVRLSQVDRHSHCTAEAPSAYTHGQSRGSACDVLMDCCCLTTSPVVPASARPGLFTWSATTWCWMGCPSTSLERTATTSWCAYYCWACLTCCAVVAAVNSPKMPLPCCMGQGHVRARTVLVQTRAAQHEQRPLVLQVLDAAAQLEITVIRTWAFCDGEEEWQAVQPKPGAQRPCSAKRLVCDCSKIHAASSR